MKSIVLSLSLLMALCVVVLSVSTNNVYWSLFKRQHGKSYANIQEELMRKAIFRRNKASIDRFNLYESQLSGYTLGLNHMSDWTEAELKQLRGLRLPENHETLLANSRPEVEQFIQKLISDDQNEVPKLVDWRSVEGRVSGVKDQGRCGSCWAFATTGVLEGQQLVRNNSLSELIPLSEQDLLDCSSNNNGCSGGIMSAALDDIKEMGGIDSEASYPYKGEQGVCKYVKEKSVMSENGFAKVPANEEALKKVVAKFGPVSVAIDASDRFHHYQSGVFNDQDCHNGPEWMNHAVLVVGYGTDPKHGDYWLVKNSWGPNWGEQGYVRIARGKNNQCGIANLPIIPYFNN